MLEDGTYDALVVDAEPAGEAGDEIRLELTVISGPHKGEVVAVRARGLDAGDPSSLLAVPATLTVTAGVPEVHLEP